MVSAVEYGTTGAVYVLSNQDTGNSVTAFNRAADGGLTRFGAFPTGGLGVGNSINAQIDPLGSQGALIVSEDGRFLFAVDAGSNEVSVLAIGAEKLVAVDRMPSGGVRPVSVTVHNNLLYVVNQTDGIVTGFTVSNEGELSPLAGATQTLVGGAQANPAQVGFTPDGTHLVVTENGTNMIDVFPVDDDGRIGPPVKNESNGVMPFAFTFAGQDLLIVSEALGSNATSSYRISPDGKLTVVSGSVATTQVGACWVVTNSVADPLFAYVSNTGSGSISGYSIEATGVLSLLNPDGQTAITRDRHGPLDSGVSSDGRYLYVLTAGFAVGSPKAVPCNKMSINAFRIGTDGSLDALPGFGTADDDAVGLAPGSEGMVAF